ncbi:MAG: GLPGLI family protein [Flavobacteriaceae bacterium]|nr:GLPGLI family protein [Flavobacteriaceae bacterium]
MKKLIIVAVLIFTSSVYSQAFENGRITYQIFNNLKVDGNEEESVSNLLKEFAEVYYHLSFSGSKAMFEKEDTMSEKKSLMEIFAGSSVYYTDIEDKQVLREAPLLDNNYTIDFPFPEWEMSQETRKIGNYICYKATTIDIVYRRGRIIEKEIIVWYTPSVPISFGLKQFSGLPGLIVEMSANHIIFKLKKIKLNIKKGVKIKTPKVKELISMEEYSEKVAKISREEIKKRKKRKERELKK